jgi:hypothetical protein
LLYSHWTSCDESTLPSGTGNKKKQAAHELGVQKTRIGHAPLTISEEFRGSMLDSAKTSRPAPNHGLEQIHEMSRIRAAKNDAIRA